MADVNELTGLIEQFRRERGWQQFHDPKDVAISLLLEASELLEHFQWKDTDAVNARVASYKDKLSEELADNLYWVLLLSNDLGIDIEQAFVDKLDKSASKHPIAKSKGNYKKYTEL
jgi:dCTP diphosphatase